MNRFLLDANMSPQTSRFLSESFGFDAPALISMGLGHIEDQEVIELAKREHRVVITFDVGFGRLYHRYARGAVGVIVLRIADQSAKGANRVLQRFFSDPKTAEIALDRSLVVIDEARARVTTEP